MERLVMLQKNEPITTSEIISDIVKRDHHSILTLIKNHKNSLEKFGTLEFEIHKSKGRPKMVFILNEQQATFLMTLMRNDQPEVLRFKEELVEQFYNMRKALTQVAIRQSNEEWQQLRVNSKITRKKETDIIKQFAEYATAQGSKNAERYYANISKMENKALFFLEQKFDNVREVLAGQQVLVIGSADQIVERSIKDGMEQGLDYHEIYQIAKSNVELFAKLVGKTPVPMVYPAALSEGGSQCITE